jgi:hypothetical protein
MTMKTKILICLGALLGVAAVDVVKNAIELPRVKVTAKVTDEQGVPITDATVFFAFADQFSTREIIKVQGNTDSVGEFAAEGHSDGMLGTRVQKHGYYDGTVALPRFGNPINGRWQPWNAMAITVLRPIGKPVALYAKSCWIDIPLIGQPCGFDLEKGDWVAPHGKGEVADFVFSLERRYVSLQDFAVTVELRFSQPRDGIQAAQMPAVGTNSIFKWSREAPENGYEPGLTMSFSHQSGHLEETATEMQAYFFRVRTVEQNGRIVNALFGKIKGGLFLAPSNSKTCKVKLIYYLNPTQLDRNLEWDSQRNLLKDVDYEETPRDP